MPRKNLYYAVGEFYFSIPENELGIRPGFVESKDAMNLIKELVKEFSGICEENSRDIAADLEKKAMFLLEEMSK